MAKNPQFQQKYEDGFRAGVAEAKCVAAATYTVKLERLINVPGIGRKTFEKIIQNLQKELTLEEQKEVQIYLADYRQHSKKGTASTINKTK